jgi:hypothetical protein
MSKEPMGLAQSTDVIAHSQRRYTTIPSPNY